jgi:hypothetical protein
MEEFYHQGDLEKTPGMIYREGGKDRQRLHKKASQVGFFTGICLPTFELLAKMIHGLESPLNQFKVNFEQWKTVIVSEMKAAAGEK